MRDTISDVCSELMSDALPILVPTSNNVSKVEPYTDCYRLNPALKEKFWLKRLLFFGYFLGWSMRTMGGLGLIGQLFYDSASQIDNGDYGAWRIMELFAGPSMGIARDAIAVGAGTMEYGYDLLGGETTNAKERQMWREITGRVPIGGQITGVKEYFVDKIAGEREG